MKNISFKKCSHSILTPFYLMNLITLWEFINHNKGGQKKTNCQVVEKIYKICKGIHKKLSLKKTRGVKNNLEQILMYENFFIKSISLGVPYCKMNSVFAQSGQNLFQFGFFWFFKVKKKRQPLGENCFLLQKVDKISF